MIKPYLEAGEFVTTHGIAGELRLYPWSDDTGFLTRFKTLYQTADGKKPLRVVQVRPHKNMCIVELEGVETVEQARLLIGKTVYIARADAGLEEGRCFVQDLIGAKVVDGDTEQEYGIIADITHPGRQDIYEVHSPAGAVFYFPAVEPFLGKVDAENEVVTVYPIPGMFEEELEKKPKKPVKSKKKLPLKEKETQDDSN